MQRRLTLPPFSHSSLQNMSPRRAGWALVLLGLLACACWLLWLRQELRPAAPPGSQGVQLTIPNGATSKSIAQLLAREGLIKNPFAFRYYLHQRGLDKVLKAGDYFFSPSLSPEEIANDLAAGKVTETRLTIPEGFTVKQIAARIAEAGLGDEGRFLEVAAGGSFDYDFLKGAPSGPDRLQGFLFPATYYFPKGAGEEKIIDTMLERFQEAYTPSMEKRAQELGLTTLKVVTLASMVEREAKLEGERPLVSAVFHNRLRLGWRLESCATVQYLLDTPKPVLLDSDLQIASPYNTYLHPGLPPGPIASPGLASLEAALNPASVPYLYFVANTDGSHTFSITLAEHIKASHIAQSQ